MGKFFDPLLMLIIDTIWSPMYRSTIGLNHYLY